MGNPTVVTIHIANEVDGSYNVRKPLPYPYHLDKVGVVGRQDYWRGSPERLIGFQRWDVQEIVLYVQEFLADPDSAIGLSPVFIDLDGTIWNHEYPVYKVTKN